MYNNSTFHDFTKSVADGGLVQGAIGPTKEGNAGFYLLTDQQLWQSAPDSASTVSRGLYAGATLHDVGTYGKPETWSATFGYLARLRPGVSLSLGLNYTANPSQAFYFGPSKANPSQRFEGNALNFQATLFTTF